MNNKLFNSCTLNGGLLALFLTLPTAAGNFSDYLHNAVDIDNATWDGEVGTSDGGVTAWTYVSYYNSSASYYVKMETSYSATSVNAPYTVLESYGPAYLTDQDTGTLWHSSSVYFGRSIAWRLNPSDGSEEYTGAVGVCSQGQIPDPLP
jgi:hypothetical protein